jgi:hypothetical protein
MISNIYLQHLFNLINILASPAPQLLSQLQTKVAGGATILGAPCLSIVNKTPDAEKIEQQKMKMMQRNANKTYGC